MFLVFGILQFFFHNIFFGFFFNVKHVMGTLSVNRFQSNLFYILYDIRLSSTFLWTFYFNVIFCVCSLLLFSNPDVNITQITGHIHRSIVDKIDPISEYVEMLKEIPYQLNWVTYFCEMCCEEFIYRAFNWSVKNTFDEPWRGPPFLASKVEG